MPCRQTAAFAAARLGEPVLNADVGQGALGPNASVTNEGSHQRRVPASSLR